MNPPFLIPECWSRIHNQRCRKPPCAKFHPVQLTACTLDYHIGSAIDNLWILSSGTFKFRLATPKLPSNKFHPNQVTFCMIVRHIGSAVLNFLILHSVSYSATPKTIKYQISSQSSEYLHFRPPYWIRHPEFLIFKLGFVISPPKIPEYQISSVSGNVSIFSAILDPPL